METRECDAFVFLVAKVYQIFLKLKYKALKCYHYSNTTTVANKCENVKLLSSQSVRL